MGTSGCGAARSAIAMFALAVAAHGQGTDLAEPVSALLRAGSHDRAMRELTAAGPAGAAAVFARWDAVRDRDPAAAAMLARALGELGTATAPLVPRLPAALLAATEPARTDLLRALANGVLRAPPEQIVELEAELPKLADAGAFYSEAADRPSFAWYEYVRLMVRARLCAAGGSPALRAALHQLEADRSTFEFHIVGEGTATPATAGVYAIEAHGAHGQRELLEAIAELAFDSPFDVAEVTAELAHYLAASPPRPPTVLTEATAGFGENRPNNLAAAAFPTRWRRDAWHIACARTVFARSGVRADRQLALRHLLFAEDAAQRAQAFDELRKQGPPLQPFAAELALCLQSGNRPLQREALITLGLDPPVAAAMAAALRDLAAGSDAELAALAQQLLPH